MRVQLLNQKSEIVRESTEALAAADFSASGLATCRFAVPISGVARGWYQLTVELMGSRRAIEFEVR